MELTNSNCFDPLCQGNSTVKFPRRMMETSRAKDIHTQKRCFYKPPIRDQVGVTPASGALSKWMAVSSGYSVKLSQQITELLF